MAGLRSATMIITVGGALIGGWLVSAGTAVADDPLQGIKDLVVSQQLSSKCAPLNYNTALERDAQYYARNFPSKASVSGYDGEIRQNIGIADPKAKALELLTSGVRQQVQDCGFTEYGVGFYRLGETDYVTVVFGKPTPAPDATPEKPKKEITLGKRPSSTGGTAPQVTVTSDVDVYDAPNGTGKKINGIFLHQGSKYDLIAPCSDNWCHLTIPEVQSGAGWVYQDGFLSVP